ncbi:MAG: 50S ribosomal protein L21 [Actinobacteria bacterium]|nr:50S ribosomal protein L21 [Actinomycetota bacterium]
MAEKTDTKTGAPATFAVIETGGKQYQVAKGDVIEVERLAASTEGDKHTFSPVLLMNRGKLRATPKELAGTSVSAKTVGEARGPKITGFTYKPKTNNRRRWGHRQHLIRIEITDIQVGSGGGKQVGSGGDKAAAAEKPTEDQE